MTNPNRNPNKPLRIAYIGAGANTRLRHLPGFEKIDRVEHFIVCNRSLESSRKVAAEFGIAHTAEEWKTVVEHPEVDAVCIGTWPYLHAPASIAALKAGKHVLTEARMAMNLSEAEQMLESANQHPNQVAQIVPAPFTLRFDAWVLKTLLGGGLGKLTNIECVDINGSALDAQKPATWRQMAKYSGRNIMTVGIFYETVQRWLGKLDPIEVSAQQKIRTEERDFPGEGRQAMTIPESVRFEAKYPDDLVLTGHFSQIHEGQPESFIRVQGLNGSFTFNQREENLTLQREGREPQQIEPAPEGSDGWKVEKDFIESIRAGTRVALTSFQDGVRYMRFTERLWDSFDKKGEFIHF